LVLVLATGAAVAGQATPAFGKSHVASGSFGGAGSGNGEFNEPFGIAVNDSTGRVYVADKGNDRVEYFSASGTYEGQFNGSDAPRGPFSGPTAVAVNQSDGDVWVADSGNNVVDEFKEAGGYVEGSQLTGPSGPNATISDELFANPDGVAVDPNNGDVYIAEKNERNEASEKGPVSVFEPSGGLITQFDSEYRPGSLAIDSNSNVYVAEPGAGVVNEYTAEVLSKEREIASPTESLRAVAVDLSDNDAYIAANEPAETEEGGSVSAYDSSGSLLESFGAGSFGAGSAPHPLSGIAVDSSSHTVYVANTAGDDVNIYVQVEGPTATTEAPATEVTATSATVPGEVNPNEAPLTECLFEYGLTSGYGQPPALCSEPSAAEVGKETSFVKVKAKLIGLTPNETYHYQLYAANASASGKGGDETFKTLAALPTVNDRPPSVNATRTTARLSGTVNPENSPTTYHFEYGTTTAYGSKTEEASTGAGYGDVSIRPQEIVELQAETTYHYRLVATNGAGTEPGPDYTFTTVSRTLPLVNTGEASGVTQTGASISGAVDPQGIETSYAFEVGTDTGYSGAKIYGDAGQGESAEPIAGSLKDLAPGTTYHYRLTATNADGTSYGQDMSFTTPGVPSPIGQPLSAPLLATPDIAFPTETGTTTKTTTKALTRTQKLAAALKQCKKDKSKKKRLACEKQAKKKYGPVKKKAKKK
jgi:DNA-binding beta-propeller fold protein YncE